MTDRIHAPRSPATSAPSAPVAAEGARTRSGFRVPGLDGLRAIAVILVIVYHLSPGALGGGYLGVDVFFVISGFLITKLLMREHATAGRISLGGFWARRARRLLPALVALLLVCGAAAWAVGGDVTVRLGTQLIGAVTFSSNWIFISEGSSYFDETTPELFRNLWSLAVEEQFYLLWPLLLLLLLLTTRRLRVAVIAIAAAASLTAMALLADPADGTRVYYGTDTHGFGLAIGALLAVIASVAAGTGSGRDGWSRRQRAGAGLAGLIGGFALVGLVVLGIWMPQDSPWTFRGGLGAVAVLTALVISALLIPGSLLGRVLEVAPLRWVGARSYGLYLWHWPVFLLLGAALPSWPRDGSGGWAIGGIAAVVTVVAAALSFRFVEQPVRRSGAMPTLFHALGRARTSTPRALAVAATTTLVLATGTATGLAVAADPGRGETQAQIEAGRAALAHPTGPASRPPAAAVAGDQITVIGDSVTLAAAPQLQLEFPGVAIDAIVSRQMRSAPEVVSSLKDAGALRPIVVVALGTNGPIDRTTLDELRSLVGTRRGLVVVNVQAPRGWTADVNDTLSGFSRDYRNVELADWHDAVQPYLDTLNRDQVHFGPTGAGIWSATVRAAVQRLADQPSVGGGRDYGAVPGPG